MLRVVLNVVVFLGTAAFWEVVAWWMHKYVMHGFGWVLHKDHHNPTGRKWQLNDAYALVFAVVSFLLIYNGLRLEISYMASAGFGVALYGLGYLLFHEIMFHKRVKFIRYRPKSRYMRRIINAHRVHHSTVTKYGAKSFSFLFARKQYI